MTTTADVVAEKSASLWSLAIPPVIWAAHLLLSYGTAAIWCAKYAGPDGSLGPARAAIAGYTLAALVGIGVVGRRGWRAHRLGSAETPHDADTPEDRHRFLGFATVLLSGLSAVAVIFGALPAVFIRSCR